MGGVQVAFPAVKGGPMQTGLQDRDVPPQTLEQLRSLVTQIQTKKTSTRLGGRALRALASIVDTPGHMAMSSISEVAAVAGVNASTLTRLSKRLGYRGFNDFQDVFRNHLHGRNHFYSQRAHELLHGPQGHEQPEAIMARVAREEARNIAATTDAIDAGALQAAAMRLIEARRVRTFGARQMHAVAYFLSYGLGMLRSDVAPLASSEHGVALGLAQLELGDLVVIVSCAPYTRVSVQTARTAADQGMHLIALTDSHASPLTAVADQCFVCQTGGSFFSNSTAALFVVVEALLTVATERMGARSLQELRRREALISEMGVDL